MHVNWKGVIPAQTTPFNHDLSIDHGLLEDVCARSGRLYAWTVNERVAIERLRGLGVHGITTGDPRLFA